MKKLLDINRLRSLGWSHKIDLDEGEIISEGIDKDKCRRLLKTLLDNGGN